MNLLAADYPPLALALSWLVALAALALAFRFDPPKAPLAAAQAASALLAVALLWSFHVTMSQGPLQGMTFHLLGATLLTLMLGAPRAMAAFLAASVLYALAFQSPADAATAAMGLLFLGLPAIAIARLSLALAQKYLPAQVFVFIFVNCFFTAALSTLAAGATLMGMLDLFSAHESEALWSRGFPVFFLLMWGDGFITGLFSAIMVAFLPRLISQFSDEFYLRDSIFEDKQNPGGSAK